MRKTTLVSMIALLTPFIGWADTVVTSKTYVDAKVSSSDSISSTSTTTAPNEAAVYGALQSAQSAVNNVLTSVVSDNDTTHAPTGDAVYDALAGKQGNIGGSTDSGKAVIATETAGTVAYKTINSAVDNTDNLITAGAVKTYADSKVSSSNTISSTSTTTAPNEAAVYGRISSVESSVTSLQSDVTALQGCTHACANTACDLITVSCVDAYGS